MSADKLRKGTRKDYKRMHEGAAEGDSSTTIVNTGTGEKEGRASLDFSTPKNVSLIEELGSGSESEDEEEMKKELLELEKEEGRLRKLQEKAQLRNRLEQKRAEVKKLQGKKILLCITCVIMLSTYLPTPIRLMYKATRVYLEARQLEDELCKNYSGVQSQTWGRKNGNKNYLISWYHLSPYIKTRREVLDLGFKPCKYNNCEMSLCKRTVEKSDAVIFDERRLPRTYEFKRPVGQIWIFAEDETPYTYDYDTEQWRSEFWRPAFNWTMTYDRRTTDIYLPTGAICKKVTRDSRDFRAIARKKTRDALLISSHCSTESKRMEYVKELQKYIDVDVLGTCGRKWECGIRWIHDNCFGILNSTYKFYLAFENALCRGYRTEKFFENINYDIILVERAGFDNDGLIEPKDVYISTSDFPNIESLGKHLKRLSSDIEEYTNLLKKKSQYYFPGFHEPYQTALCQLCEKMNAQEKYHREINDLQTEHAQLLAFCKDPTDLKFAEKGFFEWLFRKG